MKQAHIQTFGCQMNDHDSNRMQTLLEREGYSLCSEIHEDTALVLLNTCSVREKPEHKVYSLLGRIRQLKSKNPTMIIGVGGCVAQQEGDAILRREKAVDIVFGPDHIFRLPDMIRRVKQGERVLMTTFTAHEKKMDNFIPDEELENGRVDGCKAWISIMKGCDNFCTFCVVPFTRGREVSREQSNILREARDLIRKGAREITLLGQNVNSYRDRIADIGFSELLKSVADLKSLVRLRFTSPHPNDWNHKLSDLMASHPILCRQLHLPFQSGSDRILQAMRRLHTIEAYLDKIAYLKKICPEITLSTDIIVGFPGESDADFQSTLKVVKAVRFMKIFGFKYSPRPGTKAVKMEDDVPRTVKEERLEKLFRLQDSISNHDLNRKVGSIQEVLIDGYHTRRKNTMTGRTEGNVPVVVNSILHAVGDLVKVRIEEAGPQWLVGEPLTQPSLVKEK